MRWTLVSQNLQGLPHRILKRICDGLLIRSKRVASLMEMVIYGISPDLPFLTPVMIEKSSVASFPYVIVPIHDQDLVFSEHEPLYFTEFLPLWNQLIPTQFLPKFLR